MWTYWVLAYTIGIVLVVIAAIVYEWRGTRYMIYEPDWYVGIFVLAFLWFPLLCIWIPARIRKLRRED